jgi:hypothetical protein
MIATIKFTLVRHPDSWACRQWEADEYGHYLTVRDVAFWDVYADIEGIRQYVRNMNRGVGNWG